MTPRRWSPDGLQTGLHVELDRHPSGILEAGDGWAGPTHEIPRHRHPGWELYLQVHGASTWRVGEELLHLAPGWLVAVPPDTMHRSVPHARRGARHHFAYVSFSPDALAGRQPELADRWSGRAVRHSAEGLGLQGHFRALLHEVGDDRPLADVALSAALDLLLVEAVRILVEPAASGGGPVHPAVRRARHLLDDDYAKPWQIEDLALACGVSRAHLAELFTRQVGQPPYRYLLERRVERAAELLATTNHSVSDIAAEVGFSSHAQLGRSCRQVLGCTPSQWRAGRYQP